MRFKSRGKGIFLEKKLYQSNAFLNLSGKSTKILIYFHDRKRVKPNKKGGWDITNNGEIIFTYSEALEKYNYTKPRFRDAIDDLIEKGFIDIAHQGGGMVHDCSKYSISERYLKYGTEQFVKKNRKKDNREIGFASKKWKNNPKNKSKKNQT